MVVYIKILCKLKLERMDQMEDVERKLELTRYLRQEQNLNRMKVKNREDILYGTGKNSEMLYGDDGLELAEYDRIREQGHKGPMFGLRLAVSLMLFAGIQLLSLGVVAEYVGRIYEEVKGRPLYLVKRDLGQGLASGAPSGAQGVAAAPPPPPG